MAVMAAALLANGLRTEFVDTYMEIRNRMADSRLARVMDLGLGATNRKHQFAYPEAAPHMAHWERGKSIPMAAFDSTKFEVNVYNWGRRIQWHRDDREDDQTDSLFDNARTAGQSAALLPENFFFDLVTNSAGKLPVVPNAPDGVAMFNATDGDGNDRFGVSGGNIITGSGVASASAILTDYYALITRWKRMVDRTTDGEPLLTDSVLEAGILIVHAIEQTEVMEQAFRQLRQAADAPGGTGGAAVTNVILDTSRNVQLWGTPRLTVSGTDADWYAFLLGAPKMPTFYLDRQGIQEHQALMQDNNSDDVRTTGMEYVQFDTRSGAGIALPFGAIKVNNT